MRVTSYQALLPKRLALTDAARGDNPVDQLQSLKAGDALILRHYELNGSDRLTLAQSLRTRTKAMKVGLLIAGDASLAHQVAADGLHLPSWMAARGDVWTHRRKANWIITAAAHGERELRTACLAGADAALLSPAFATASHPGAQGLGPVRFARLACHANVPVYALGGITPASLQRLRGIPNLIGGASVSAAQ